MYDTFSHQNRVSLPWVEDHPDVFNDAAFTMTATDSLDFSPPTSPLTAVPVVSRDHRDEEQCVEGKICDANLAGSTELFRERLFCRRASGSSPL